MTFSTSTHSPSQATQTEALKISGTGLITGLPVNVSIQQGEVGDGIVFDLGDGVEIPALLETVVNADRGVTLGHPSGKTLSIVEHFLCACSLMGLSNLRVRVEGAPELPLLDGSAAPWLDAMTQHFQKTPSKSLPDLILPQALFYEHNETTCLYALPSSHFKITYSVNFPHPGLEKTFEHWDSLSDKPTQLAPARTFGFVRELPILQAQGLAKGVSLENTLGLTDEGGYTAPLRFENEPVKHKMLDLIGDLTLMGFNPMRIKAHIYAFNAGHSSHTAFAKILRQKLQT